MSATSVRANRRGPKILTPGRVPSKKTSGTCRVCGDECHPWRGQRIGEHTEASHYEDLMDDVEPRRRKELRAIALAAMRPNIRALIRKRATYLIGKTGRTATGRFDHNGWTFIFVEDNGAIWEIDDNTARDETRLRAHLRFR